MSAIYWMKPSFVQKSLHIIWITGWIAGRRVRIENLKERLTPLKRICHRSGSTPALSTFLSFSITSFFLSLSFFHSFSLPAFFSFFLLHPSLLVLLFLPSFLSSSDPLFLSPSLTLSFFYSFSFPPFRSFFFLHFPFVHSFSFPPFLFSFFLPPLSSILSPSLSSILSPSLFFLSFILYCYTDIAERRTSVLI